jgi:hypothetical protein
VIVADDAERLSDDDLAFWLHFCRQAEAALAARDVALQHLARKYMLGPTRRLGVGGVIEVAGPAPDAGAVQPGGRVAAGLLQ